MSLMDTRKADVEHHLGKYPDKLSAIMPLLYIAQEEYGYITNEAVEEIANLLDVDTTHVRGIMGFYVMYHDEPKGKYLVYICTDLPCALKGAEAFSQRMCDHLGVEAGGTTEDGLFTLEEMMCLGACHRTQVMQVNFQFHENMDDEKAIKLFEELRREHEVSKPFSGE
ncbi:MAG: NAD(P)H-dependent oxidoreductase subunit E [Chloroflexi bacterium]|nr:NAD(P)H-dependent oxidoreductase subunit E [Chloroflexota bacterium]